jgi:Fic family protein
MNIKQLENKKNHLDTFRPLNNVVLSNLADWFRIELTYNSNAIEGNTLTRQETALVIEKGLTVGGKALVEHLEATNHSHAIEWIRERAKSKKAYSKSDILSIHILILSGIDSENAGKFRTVSVRISGSKVNLALPIEVPVLMQGFLDWLNQNTLHPVELAAEAHLRFVRIHPFTDGNGRTARLLMNLILLKHGYPSAIIKNRDRLDYINALETAHMTGRKKLYKDIIYKAVNASLDIFLNAAQNKPASNKPSHKHPKLLKIGELAKKAGETNSTIRYWTMMGLLEVSDITPSGYQLYSSEMVSRIQAIQKLKKKRLTLIEIKQKLV